MEVRAETHGSNLNAGADAEVLKLLAALLHMACTACFLKQPRKGLPTVSWAPQ